VHVNDPEAVRAYQRGTSYGDDGQDEGALGGFTPLDPALRPEPFKTYPAAVPVPLPRELTASSQPAAEVLSGARPPAGSLDDDLLATILFLAAGVTRGRLIGGRRLWYRAAMSAGNLHPIELYVVRRGVHHYQPLTHSLVELRPADEVTLPEGTAALVLTGIPFRTCWKYSERGWRHLFWDAGTLLANVLAVAAAHGVEALVRIGFPDAAVAGLVGADGRDELPIALVTLGDHSWSPPAEGALESVRLTAAPFGPRVVRFPLLEAAHAAGTFGSDDVEGWRAAGGEVSTPAPAQVEPPAIAGAGHRVEEVILRRGSTREFRRERAGWELLDWALPAAALAVPTDVAPAATLVEHLVSVHDVEDREPGPWRFRAGAGFSAGPASSVEAAREVSQELCLGQELGGDSAYTVFHAVDLDPLLSRLGARGYRAAQLEAGIVSGRLALAAFTLGAGATGLTFYDGATSRHFDSPASPLLATAIGPPAHPPAAGGSPGEPVELRRR
jgi:SagB-type dehydrogenase family enzyme